MLVSRDPFARTEIHRTTVKTTESCKWCGQNYKTRLFQYSVESDGGRKSDIPGLFCSRDCCRNYHAN